MTAEAPGPSGARRPPVVFSLAGSDPSGGAGIQADLKTFSALGAYGCAALTALTAQSTQGVTGVHSVPPAFVREQVETLVADVTIDATKIGMLGSAEIAETVADLLPQAPLGAVILDPVMVTTSGSRLLDDDAVDAVRRLACQVDLVTPNLDEAAVLLDEAPARSLDEQRGQAERLFAAGMARVLVKGGHGDAAEATDVLVDGAGSTLLRAPRINTRHTHGTGCSLSAAIAALLPQRDGDWGRAVNDAKSWLTDALRAGPRLEIGSGAGPVHHFHAWW